MKLKSLAWWKLNVALASALFGACSNPWPPYEQEARENFVEKREAFERLVDKMRATDLWRVSLAYDTTVDADPSLDDPSQQYTIDDDEEWHDLLVEVSMYLILQEAEGVVVLGPGYSPYDQYDNRMGFIHYAFDPNATTSKNICQPRYEDILCGQCVAPLETDWHIEYRWMPEVALPETHDAYLNGEISLDAYSEAESDALQECFVDGFESMGVDSEELMRQVSQ